MENYIKKMISEALDNTAASPETKKGIKGIEKGNVAGTNKSGVESAEIKSGAEETTKDKLLGTDNANLGVAGVSKDKVLGTDKTNLGVAGVSKDKVLGTDNANLGVAGVSKDKVLGTDNANLGVAGVSKDKVLGTDNANLGVAGVSKDKVLGMDNANLGVAGVSKDKVLGTDNANLGVAGASNDKVLGIGLPNNTNAVRGENIKGEVQGMYGCECMTIKPCEKQSLAMAFVPNQVWRDDLFEPETALELGTAFPCLYKPFLGGGKK